MKLLLLGHKGYLGSYLHKNLKYVHDISPVLNDYDYIINCIGKPNLEYCQTHPEISEISNYKVIIPYIEKYPKSKIINFSSYYVYDDIWFCTETSNTTNAYNYTLHNLRSEELIRNYRGVSFRLGKLFGNNNDSKLTNYILTNTSLVLDSVNFNPTSVLQVLRVIEHELEHNYMEGIYNLSNAGYTNHYSYGVFINNILNTNKQIHKVKKMTRTFHNYGKFLMSIKKLQNEFSLTDWKEDIKLYLEKL